MTDKQLALYLEQLNTNLCHVLVQVNNDLLDRGIHRNTTQKYSGPQTALSMPFSSNEYSKPENWSTEEIDTIENFGPLWDFVENLNINIKQLLGEIDATNNTAC